MVFPHTFLIHTDFFPRILIFQGIYTDFVSGHSGRSVCWLQLYCLLLLPRARSDPIKTVSMNV